MKKLLSFSLCAVLLISSLTACRRAEPKKPINNSEEPSTSTPVEPTPEITPDPIQEPEIDSTSDTANILDNYIEDMDSQQIKDVLTQEPTDIQKDTFECVINEFSIPDIGSEITVDEEGTAHYTDTAGNEVEVEADQNLINKSDEELKADYNKMMEELKNYQNINKENVSKADTSNSNNKQNTDNISYGDDLTPEQYAEVERQVRELFEQNGGTIITDSGREGQIDDETEEYIRKRLTGEWLDYNP